MMVFTDADLCPQNPHLSSVPRRAGFLSSVLLLTGTHKVPYDQLHSPAEHGTGPTCSKAILKLQGPWTHYDNSTPIGASTDPGINKFGGGGRGATLIFGNFLHEKCSWCNTVVEFLSSMMEILGSIPSSASSPHNKVTEKKALRWACTHHPL